jgi:hypothetical protein
MIQLQWKPIGHDDADPLEFVADLPSGGRAYLKCESGLWVVTRELRGRQESCGVFATAYDAQAAVEADETQYLLSSDNAGRPLHISDYPVSMHPKFRRPQ